MLVALVSVHEHEHNARARAISVKHIAWELVLINIAKTQCSDDMQPFPGLSHVHGCFYLAK